jgi:hypothetical protein
VRFFATIVFFLCCGVLGTLATPFSPISH